MPRREVLFCASVALPILTPFGCASPLLSCAVFGRCIAGRGLQGNMPYFTMVIVMGYAGAITTGAAGVAALTGVISAATGATG